MLTVGLLLTLCNYNNHHFTIIQKNWRISLVQSFTACMPLLTATSALGLGRRRWSSPQQCYLHCLHTL